MYVSAHIQIHTRAQTHTQMPVTIGDTGPCVRGEKEEKSKGMRHEEHGWCGTGLIDLIYLFINTKLSISGQVEAILSNPPPSTLQTQET